MPLRFPPRFVVLLVALALCVKGSVLADQVSIWSSDVREDLLEGIYPIGGMDEENRDFVVATLDQGGDEALQLGLRIWAQAPEIVRFDGDRTFRVPAGAMLDEAAAWSYDLHLDFGSSSLGAVVGRDLDPQTMQDFEVVLRVDRDPSAAVQFQDTEVPAVIDPIQLLQSRENVLVATFYGGPYPEMLTPGIYELVLELREPNSTPNSTFLLSTSLVLVVEGPLSIPISSPPARFALIAVLLIGAFLAIRRLAP